MFEFSIAKGYLWPKRKRLSASLISIMSIFVISLVIWLLNLFLSVTEGIEKNWLTKLTTLNAPLRIVPTQAYYDSYYYQIDSISSRSHFSYKSIGEKYSSSLSDPYDPEIDEEIPFYWSKGAREGKAKDLVKSAYASLENLKQKWPDLVFQDYEIAGALMRLRLIRPQLNGVRTSDSQSFLTQASYIASFSDQNPKLSSLIQPPNVSDLNHLLYLTTLHNSGSHLEDRPQFITSAISRAFNPFDLSSILRNINLESIRINSASWQLPLDLLPLHKQFKAFAYKSGRTLSYLLLSPSSDTSSTLETGILERTPEGISFTTKDGVFHFKEGIAIFLDRDLVMSAKIDEDSLTNALSLCDVLLEVNGSIQGIPISGKIAWRDLNIEKGTALCNFDQTPKVSPPWIHTIDKGLILPKNAIVIPAQFHENQVLLGDGGYLAYNATTPTAVQELRSQVYVAGFYDPGIFSIGAKVLLTDPTIVRNISSSGQNISLDPLMSNGLSIWFQNLKQTNLITSEIQDAFKISGIDSYWRVVPYHEYDFAKDLLKQFKSDRYLFVLIGIIILAVACSNIISQLLLLVNDKKQEIGILLSLGAKKRSIALIFGLCGTAMGIMSCLLGLLAAYFTLTHIDSLVHLLNLLEGQQAFNTSFYGQSLPNELSKNSLTFTLIVTPILSFIAGLIPAVKACRLRPSDIMRSH